MNSHWHEQIQRYANGQASVEEAVALQTAMKNDSELRALYLDYMNLDVALAEAAEVATVPEYGIGRVVPPLRPRPALSTHHWRWLAATAACVALVMLAMPLRHRNPAQTRPDIDAACSSIQEAIARLSVEPPSSFPAWASPTASMLDQLHPSNGDL